MECNKDEAIRAKEIAERKMQSRDFVGARKVALRAQQLYSGLENIPQMLLVCDVHCASEKKISNESDWYSILQVEPTADEATIRKQYRKSALLLHPDKNKFPGAEAAFKLVVEAQRVLLDHTKRSIFDMKLKVVRSASVTVKQPQQPAPKPTWYPYGGVQNNSYTNITGRNPREHLKQKPTHQGVSSGPTFWTKCPYCAVRYQYYLDVLQKPLRCQSCTKTFIARAEPSNLNQPRYSQQRGTQKQSATVVEDRCEGNSGVENSKVPVSSKESSRTEAGTEKDNGKRKRKQSQDSSESLDTESSSDSEGDVVLDDNNDILSGQNIESHADQNLRRSGRHKQQVSYKENVSDDEDLTNHPKKAKGSRSFNAVEKDGNDTLKKETSEIKNQPERQKGASHAKVTPCNNKETENKIGAETVGESDSKISETCSGVEKKISKADDASSNSSLKSAEDPESYECPESEFNDFDKDKKEGCFAAGQIWAVYDTLDAMPRFYARVKKVFSPGFKLQITWLEPETEWEDEALPVSCGNFKTGDTENTEDRLMFSHLACWEKGKARNTYRIFPRKGETWALFKNWNIRSNSNTETDMKYEYEFVEVLSDYAEDSSTHVAYLAKVKGFVSVFYRVVKDGVDVVQIASNQLFRFSHLVPSHKLTGEEREGVPKGSFELDPASLPANLEEVTVHGDLKVETVSGNVSYSDLVSSRKLEGSDESTPMNKDEPKEAVGDDEVEPNIQVPEPEFYNFDADKSTEKFKVGQIWAMYGDEDALPKYYVEIRKIEAKPVFKLYIRWLSPCFSPNIIQWQDDDMPTCCGRFRVKKSGGQVYTSTSYFSHLVKAEVVDKKDEYDIFPREGEVWALYRNWNAAITCFDLEKCEYEIVEILEKTDRYTKVILLERVNDFKSVFRPQVKGRSNIMRNVRLTEMLRFSHQIPAFRLTDQKDGSLQGFWELDPAALPIYYFKLES